MTLTKRFLGDDGGIYYVRQVGDLVYWFGESLTAPRVLGRERDARAFANVFVGRRTGDEVTGEWFDVPKGRTRGAGTLRLRVSEDDTRMERISGDGGFGGRTWRADAAASRTSAHNVFHKPGFQSTSTDDLSGAWMGDDGGVYYVRQRGNRIVWFGERGTSWANVFVGTIEGDRIHGQWVDVPKTSSARSGELTLARPNHYQLHREGVTGGFGGSNWERVLCKGVAADLQRLTVVTKQDLLDGDEPYLWTVWLKIDGDHFTLSDRRNGHATIVSTSESHGDLHASNQQPGSTINVPAAVGQFGTVLKTIRGIDPLSSVAHQFTMFGLIVLAWEEDGLTNAAVEAGRRAFLTTLQTELDNAIHRLSAPDQTQLVQHLIDATRAAIAGGPIDILHFLFNDYADDLIGQALVQRSFDQLRPSETLRFDFRDGAHYALVGTLTTD
jgi:hypothetical protein